MRYYDIDAIIEDAEPYDVAEYIGMDIRKKGSKYFILCPGHEKRLRKPDKHFGNCVLTATGYFCFACHESVNIIQMVMEYTGENFPEALGIVADSCGGRERYLLSEDKKRRNSMRMPLSKEDLEAIGLYSKNQLKSKTIVCASDVLLDERPYYEKDIIYNEHNEEQDCYLYFKSVQNNSLLTLYQEEREVFYSLVCQKAAETLDEYRKIFDIYTNRNAIGFECLVELLKGEDGYLDDMDLYYLKQAIKEQHENVKRILEECITYLPQDEQSNYSNIRNQVL